MGWGETIISYHRVRNRKFWYVWNWREFVCLLEVIVNDNKCYNYDLLFCGTKSDCWSTHWCVRLFVVASGVGVGPVAGIGRVEAGVLFRRAAAFSTPEGFGLRVGEVLVFLDFFRGTCSIGGSGGGISGGLGRVCKQPIHITLEFLLKPFSRQIIKMNLGKVFWRSDHPDVFWQCIITW